MSAANNMQSEHRRKSINEGPVTLCPALLSKIKVIVESSSTDPALASFASTITAAAALQSYKERAPLLKLLLNTLVTQTKLEPFSKDSAAINVNETAQAMVQLVCDLILSPGTKALHKPLLAQMKLLPSAYLSFINTYISTRFTDFLDQIHRNNERNSEKVDKFQYKNLSLWIDVDVTSSLDSLLFFPEFRPCITDFFVPLLSYVVELLEESVDRALHAVGDCGAVGWQSIQAVSERVCVIYAMLRDCSSTIRISTEENDTINGSIVQQEPVEPVEEEVEEVESIKIIEEQSEIAAVVYRAYTCLINIMQRGTLPKECMASAAVALCAIFTLPDVDSATVAAEIADGLLLPSFSVSLSAAAAAARIPPGSRTAKQSWIGSYLMEKKDSSLHAELQKLGPMAALCMLRGFLQSASTPDLIQAVFPFNSATHISTPNVTSSTAGDPKNEETNLGEEKRVRVPSWSFLTDGVICTLCNAMAASVDLHFKIAALQTVNVCVDHLIVQWKSHETGQSDSGGGKDKGGKKNKKEKKQNNNTTAGGSSISAISSCPVVLTPSQQHLLLRVLWQSWDDTQVNAWRVAYQQFAQLLTLIQLQNAAKTDTYGQYTKINSNNNMNNVKEEENGKESGIEKGVNKGDDDFFLIVARDLLALGPEQKRRYGPLAALVPHIGAKNLIILHPTLVSETLAAMAYNAALTSPATLMLSVLWSTLKEESAGDNGELWQRQWVPQITEVLCSKDEGARKVVCAYAVPAVAEIEPKALEILFREVAVKATEDVAAAAVIGLLSAGRKLNLIQDLHSFCSASSTATNPPPANNTTAGTAAPVFDISALLHQAVSHHSDALRAAAFQLVCIHPRTTALPTAEELELVQEALNMDMHTTSSFTRQNIVPPLGRLLARIRIASAAIVSRPKDFPADSIQEVRRCEAWLQRFSAGVVANAYPRAQYARKYMAVDILSMLLEVYGDLLPLPKCINSTSIAEEGETQQEESFERLPKSSVRRKGPLAALRKGDGGAGSNLTRDLFQPFSEDFYQPSLVNMLLGCIVDSWDKVREAAAGALLLLPAPLPGLNTQKEVYTLLQWGLQLLSSPKLKDADAGARILLLVFQHFVVGTQGWRVGVNPAVVYKSLATHSGARHAAVMDFLATLVGLISSRVDAGEADLTAASRESLAHGPLLALRYILPVVPWRELLSTDSETRSSTQAIAERLLIALKRLNNLVLPILSMPEEMTRVGAADVEANDYCAATEILVGAAEGEQGEEGLGSNDELLGPEAQVITSACWMNAKELALVIGTLCRVAPIAAAPLNGGLSATEGTSSSASYTPPLLSPSKLASAGELLLRILLESKHSGVVDKTQPSLEVFAAAVMGADSSSSSSLSELPFQWLTRLIKHMNRPGQTRRDIIRRSSGLPYAIQALLRAKPEGGARMLAARGFQELFATASAENLPECWPRVHAFNALRMAFSDTEILIEAGAFHSQGLQISITALAAPEWEVRNAAMLCFTTLLIKVLGFANVATRSISSKRAVTAAEFFAMHPSLHPFLLAQLQRAAEELEAGSKDLHPSLSPILTLLMRLKPDTCVQPLSFASRSDNTELDSADGGPLFGFVGQKSSSSIVDASPAAFIPLIQRCATARPMAVRQQAAKALVPLVPAEALSQVAGALAIEVAAALKSTTANKLATTDKTEWNANVVQGQLLQLVELVHMVADNRDVAAVHAEALLSSIASPLKSCAAVCTLGRYPCLPLSHAFLRLIEALAGLLLCCSCVDQETSAASLIQLASQNAWQGILELSEETSSNQIMSGVALKEATLLRLLWSPLVFSSSNPSQQNWVDEVTMALQHGRNEVRSAALKAALRLLGNGSVPGAGSATAVANASAVVLSPAERAALCAVLGVHITRESHEKSLRRTAHVLSLLLSQQQGSFYALPAEDEESAALVKFFADIAQHAQHAPDPVTKRYALISLGPLLHAILLSNKDNISKIIEEAGVVATLGAEFSSSDQISELRLAAVTMLGSSGLLQCAAPASHVTIANTPTDISSNGDGTEVEILQEYQIAAWDAIITLMEDEDSDVREASAEAAAAAMEGWDEAPPRTGCVEKINVAVLRALAGRIGPVPALLRMLCRRTCEIEPLQMMLNEILAAAKEKENGNMAATKRLFEIEADNLHEEPLLAAQLAAQALAEVVAQIPKGSSDAAKILAWGRQAAVALRDAIKACPQGWDSITGCDSTSELEIAFFPVYCLVLAMWAAGHCSREEGRYRGEIRGIIREINKRKAFSQGLGKHPLLRAVWSATVHEWQLDSAKNDAATTGEEDSTVSAAAASKRKRKKVLLYKPTYFLPDIMPWEMDLLSELSLSEKAAGQGRRGPSFHCTII